MLENLTKFPAPYFGGKTYAAPHVWQALGDVAHYVEPFCGSCAVLLLRPHECNRTYHSETVNDADGLLVNALRSIQLHPEETAEAASCYVSEADLMSRHLALLRWVQEQQLERLMADPVWCDPVMGGWWLWGLSCWIGGGWCDGSGPWVVGADDRITNQGRPGVSRRRPQLGANGRGVNHAGAREPGVAPGTPDRPWEAEDFHPMTMPEVLRWFRFLSARLRHVRIINGDWKRVVTTGAALTLPVRQGKGPCGVFLDPPYADTANRDDRLYRCDSEQVAHEARAWCLAHGDDPRYRIVLAAFDGEHGSALRKAGWRCKEWFQRGHLRGGMGNLGGSGNNQQHRERLWLSPHCLAQTQEASLFDGCE